MKQESVREIGIFLGLGEHPEQLPLAARRRQQNWIIAESPDSSNYKLAKKSFKGARIIINGSGAGACVAFAAEDALRMGAIEVHINFEHIMTSNEGADPILTRARHFFEQLPNELARDTRLILLPKGIRSRLRT